MVKTIFKEIFIIILLSVVIVLLLGIVFYDYIPTKPVPPETKYTMNEEIKNEISNEIQQEDSSNAITIDPELYELENEDLDLYKSTNHYLPGRVDPYEEYEEPISGSTAENTENVEQVPKPSNGSGDTGILGGGQK